MEKKILEYAYAGLLHDIGKFYQRTELKSTLTNQEYECTPIHKKLGYHTHIHAGYTSKFFKKYLGMENNLERASSSHHLNNLDELDLAIKEADCIASSIDRNDEEYDYEEGHQNSRYKYLISRLNSVFYEIDFGKERRRSYYPLKTIDEIETPQLEEFNLTKDKASLEYSELFHSFIEEVQKDNLLYGKPTPYKFHRMYSLLYKNTTLIPASTYETNYPTVSLFDHLKLTSAISSCLACSCEKQFYMFEFDVSGIQNFIYKITEGKETKPKIAKSLRGRSAFVSLLTNAITYTILNEFELTEANIIFNTGGGGIILLPYLNDTEEKIQKVCQHITHELYQRFHTELTFVYAYETMDAKELELFKSEKALSLKVKLDEAKQQKYKDLIDDDFVFQPLVGNKLCQLCQDHYVTKDNICDICQDIIKISDYYTAHEQFFVVYDFNDTDYDCSLYIDIGFVRIIFLDKIPTQFIDEDEYTYIDAINCFDCGNVKLIANMVPKDKRNILSFEEIVNLLDASFGDRKLGILKMDVDNLGAIFAFGLKQKNDDAYELQRSLSKYLTLSRFMEIFFSKKLKEICLKVSKQLTNRDVNIFYINYAGGDDLVIMGPIYGIVKLAYTIHEEFKKYVQNDNVTISGGIHIQNAKKPIRFGVQYADEALELSKASKHKNALTIMGVTVPFDEMKDIFVQVEKYRQYIKNGKLSRTSFYHIMSYINDGILEDYYEAIPKIQYTLYRTINEESLRLEIAKDLTSIREEKMLKKLILMMKLTILFTREEK